jgi:WD40 repeat protein
MSNSGNPFVGLRPFNTDESILFFGRQQQTFELLQRLHQFHFVAIIGSSGSGKSSLVRAGLIPSLKAGYLVSNRDRWVIATMKPGQTVLCNLAQAILEQQNGEANNASVKELEDKIREGGVDEIRELLEPLWKENNTNFVFLVDQFEELFRFSLQQNVAERKDEAIDFVNILLGLSTAHPAIYVVITMRSDFIGDCSQFYGLPEAINQSHFLVPRLSRQQLKTIIEGPVKLYNGSIAPALTARLLNDVQLVKDELPLLQHVLMRLWDQNKNEENGIRLKLDDYNKIGGIEKALSNHADEALQRMTAEELLLTKKIFQALTTIDDDGRKIRRPAHLTEIAAITGATKETLDGIINKFIEDRRSFLIVSKTENKDDELIDISHESLIRQWGTLNLWVDEEAESGKIVQRLTESQRLYEKKEKDLLTGNELQLILQWYITFSPGRVWAERYSSSYEKSLEYLRQSEAEEKKQRLRKIETRRTLISLAILVVIVTLVFTLVVYKNNIKNQRQLVINYWQRGEALRTEDNILDGLHFIAAATDLTDENELTKTLLIDGESLLPKMYLIDIINLNSIVTHAIFSPDASSILAVTNDGSARLLDKTTGKQIESFKQGGVINSAVFNRDGSKILTSGNDGTVRCWDVKTGKQTLQLNNEDNITSAVFSPDEKVILAAGAHGAFLWDAVSGKQVAFLRNPNGFIDAVFSPDGQRILTSGKDMMVNLWQITNLSQPAPVKFAKDNEQRVITHALFSPDGSKVLTTKIDSTFDLSDVTTGQKLFSIKINSAITSAVFSQDGKWILTASKNKSALLWDAETGRQINGAMKHDGPVYSATFSPNGRLIVTAGWDKVIRVWSLADDPGMIEVPIVSRQNVSDVTFTPDGKKMLTVDKNGGVVILSPPTGKVIDIFNREPAATRVLLTPNGNQVLTTERNWVRIWDTRTKKQIVALKHSSSIDNCSISFSGKKVLTVTDHSNILTWSIDPFISSKPALTLHYPGIKSAFLSPDESSILIATGDSSAHLISTTGKPVLTFKHEDDVATAVFSPDGKFILTASWDYTARVWSVATGKQVGPVMKHSNAVNSAVFSDDGKWVLTTAWDSSCHLWSRVTFREIGFPRKNISLLADAVVSPDEKWIASLTKENKLFLWELEGDLDIPEHLFKLQAQVITGVELNMETAETQGIPKEKWILLKNEYNNRAKYHYSYCRYRKYNIWKGFTREATAK